MVSIETADSQRELSTKQVDVRQHTEMGAARMLLGAHGKRRSMRLPDHAADAGRNHATLAGTRRGPTPNRAET
ncbi:hypothetical protein BWR19_18580 [Halomonas sp. 1513]|nr:hypothetical protein BWR19_18580 [Halomonas sp. 1513]